MSTTATNSLAHMTDEEHEALSNRGLAIYEEKLKPILEPLYDKKICGDPCGYRRLREEFLVMKKIGNEPERGLVLRLFAGQMMAAMTAARCSLSRFKFFSYPAAEARRYPQARRFPFVPDRLLSWLSG